MGASEYRICCLRNIKKRNVNKEISRIVFQSLFFRTVGLIGDCAVKSGLLALPDFEGPAAMYIRENTKAVKEAYLERRLKC